MSSRRYFIKQSVAGTTAAAFMPALWLPRPTTTRPPDPLAVRVRGQVRVGGEGRAGVRVTDGRALALTDADGTYELIADARQPFVYCSLPAETTIPTDAQGSARHYARLNGSREQEASFDLEPLGLNDERHTFLVLADPQTQNQEETGMLHAETVPDVQRLMRERGDAAVFGIGCGDLMWDNLDLFPDYERAVSEMGIPFFQVVGNHDLDFGMTDDGSADTFKQHFGPAHYSFDRGAVHYVVLDDVFWHGQGYIGYITEEQLTWLEADLASVEAGRTVVVFGHIPLLSTQYRRRNENAPSLGTSITNREALYALLEPYTTHFIAGHTHELEHTVEEGIYQHVCGAVCGAWWSGPICHDGTPKGYSIFEVNDGDVRWSYKSTGHPADHQIRLYAPGSDPSAPNEVIANVWDASSDWMVVWYEDGERKGEMARRVGLDPMAVELHTGPALPERRPWVEPLVTNHLYYAPANPDAREIRVEATNPWGQTFSAVLS